MTAARLVVALLVVVACGGASPLAPTASTPPAATTSATAPTASVATAPTASVATAPTATPGASPTTAVELDGRLLFSRFIEATHTLDGSFVSRPDGSAETAIPLPWTEGAFRWSRSGTEIAVATQLDDERIGTAIIAVDGTVLRILEIPDPTLSLFCGLWSPLDDTRLTCLGWDDADPSRRGIYTVRASDGGDLQRLRLTAPPEGMSDLPGDYSPAGQLVFKRAVGDEDDGQLMLVDASGGEPRPLSTRQFGDPGRFSPDGTMVLTSSGGRIVIVDLDGKVVYEIRDAGASFGPAWSPDGTRIVFSRATEAYAADIFTSLPDGSDRQQVTQTPDNEIGVDWGVGDL